MLPYISRVFKTAAPRVQAAVNSLVVLHFYSQCNPLVDQRNRCMLGGVCATRRQRRQRTERTGDIVRPLPTLPRCHPGRSVKESNMFGTISVSYLF